MRGYNQAELIAEGLSEAMNIPVKRLLVRDTNGSSQRKLGRRERISSVKGIFSASAGAGSLRLWLIDDVCTTGATLESCAWSLRGAGAAEVLGYAFARRGFTEST